MLIWQHTLGWSLTAVQYLIQYFPSFIPTPFCNLATHKRAGDTFFVQLSRSKVKICFAFTFNWNLRRFVGVSLSRQEATFIILKAARPLRQPCSPLTPYPFFAGGRGAADANGADTAGALPVAGAEAKWERGRGRREVRGGPTATLLQIKCILHARSLMHLRV